MTEVLFSAHYVQPKRFACVPAVLVLALALANPVQGQAEEVNLSKSESATLAWSLVGTIAPVAAGKLIAGDPESGTEFRALVGGSLVACGVVFGPSLGYIYSGNEQAIGMGATLRMSGLACGVVARLVYDNHQTSGTGTWVDDALATGGLLLIAGGTILDWVRAPAMLHGQQEAARAAQARRVELRPSLAGLSLLIRIG